MRRSRKKKSLWRIAPLIITSVKELSNIRWWMMVDGDRNTKFFHQGANRRRKLNAMHKIKLDGEPLLMLLPKKNDIVYFYENLY